MNDLETSMFGIWLIGYDAYPVAIFRDSDLAEEWARDCYFGQWVMKKIVMKLPPFATEEEWEEAKIKAAKMTPSKNTSFSN